ncbi:MAG: ribonuclease HII, partial [Bacteroidales bacterium]|nr:ribonuclease HII [Bacteroidales bacterium]
AMHKAIEKLSITPQLLLIDGNRFRPFEQIPHKCFIKGDGRFLSIAAASILAKTYRDEFMEKIHRKYPEYKWDKNKGYPTKRHKLAISSFGITPYHRKSFRLNEQLKINFM